MEDVPAPAPGPPGAVEDRAKGLLARTYELTAALAAADDLGEVARAVFERGLSVLGADAGALALPPPGAPGELELVETFGYPSALIDAWRRFPVTLEAPVTEAFREGRPVWVGTRAEAAAAYPAWAEAVTAGKDQAWAGVPLQVAGRTIGALGLTFYAPRRFDEEEQAFTRAVAQLCAQAVHRAQLVAELRAANAEEREGSRRKDAFLAVLSHELRNPLAPLQNALVVLDRSPPGSGTAARARETLQRQVTHLARLVNDLLDVSRFTHGKIALDRTTFDARAVVRRACDDAAAGTAQRAVAVELPPAPVWVNADAARLAQITGNLLGNAFKFTRPGGRISVRLSQADGACELAVADDGEGIEPRLLDGIFEPFAQAERTLGRADGGMGIGLALVRSLVALHGGTVRAASEGPGRGAEFVVRLPLAPAPAVDAEALAAPARGDALDVLVVDDHADAGETLCDVLRLDGHRVRLARDGQECLAALEAARPDVLVCDLGLPDVSGLEVIRHLRARPGGGALFAVALSGFAQASDVAAAHAAGFDAHLAKPPDLARLGELFQAAARARAGR